MNDESERDGWFVRAAGAVGDLGNPPVPRPGRGDGVRSAGPRDRRRVQRVALAGAAAGAAVVFGLMGWKEIRARHRESVENIVN